MFSAKAKVLRVSLPLRRAEHQKSKPKHLAVLSIFAGAIIESNSNLRSGCAHEPHTRKNALSRSQRERSENPPDPNERRALTGISEQIAKNGPAVRSVQVRCEL